MKTNKQKSLEMWEWLRDNPEYGCKEYYEDYLRREGRHYEYSDCWACSEDEEINRKLHGHGKYSRCKYCPIFMLQNSCMDSGSPYLEWDDAKRKKERQIAASKMVKLIKTAWKE